MRVAGPVYEAAIAAELRWRRCPRPRVDGTVDDVTVVIKTHERPAVLQRLLASIRREYPGIRVLVADDSRVPIVLDEPDTRVLALPHDVGLSAGRNRALEEVSTPFFWLLDDDFVFCGTELEPSLRWLRAHDEIDLVGGQVIDLPGWVASPRRALGPGEWLDGLRRYAKVPNFFLARTEKVRALGWDEELKLVEHADFFERARGVLGVVSDPRMRVLHARRLFDMDYVRKREDVAAYVRLRREKRRRRGSAD